jgi:hypothetical protein
MTGREMQYVFNIIAGRDDIGSEKIFYYINLSITDFVLEMISERQSDRITPFERTQKNVDSIQSIVKYDTVSLTVSPSDSNVYVGDMTTVTDFWFLVRERCTYSYSDCHGNRVVRTQPVINANMNNIDAILEDPFSEHVILDGYAKPVRLFYDNNVAIHKSGSYTPSSYNLYYISSHSKVTPDNTSDLPESTHDDIVRHAYQLYLQDMKINKNIDSGNPS